jgi:hypothetical protein
LPEVNSYKKHSVNMSKNSYEETNYVTDDSRATHPAWTYRDIEQDRWERPMLNPLDKLEKPFHHNLNTRILEKDYFKPVSPKLQVSSPFPNL